MMVVGVGGVVVVAVMLNSASSFKAQATAEAGQDLTQLMYEVNSILNNTTRCTLEVTGTPIANGAAIPDLSPAIAPGTPFGKLQITSITLEDITPIGSNYTGEVQITGTR